MPIPTTQTSKKEQTLRIIWTKKLFFYISFFHKITKAWSHHRRRRLEAHYMHAVYLNDAHFRNIRWTNDEALISVYTLVVLYTSLDRWAAAATEVLSFPFLTEYNPCEENFPCLSRLRESSPVPGYMGGDVSTWWIISQLCARLPRRADE